MDAARRAGAAVLLALLVLVGCAGPAEQAPAPAGLRVASFDFAESRLLAELYAVALEQEGFVVDRHLGLGPREVVAPALEQDLVDLVPEYAGSALRFLSPAGRGTPPAQVEEGLRRALQPRGLVALAAAPGQDQNGVVVSSDTAERLGLADVSDLAAVAGDLVLGGPPECPERPLCLRGLERTYGLEFRGFVPFPSRAATAEALLAGQLDVGVLETVDPYLADGRLLLLEDDRGLQPPEPVVPVVRRSLLDEHGARLTRVLDGVTATLTTAAMTELNRQVVLEGRSEHSVALDWLRDEVNGRR